MSDIAKLWAIVMAGLAVLVFSVGGLSMAYKGTFLPWEESVRRQTFEQSQTYVHGKINHLNRLRQDYARAESDGHKCAIRSTALHEAGTATRLPDDLQAWITELENTPC